LSGKRLIAIADLAFFRHLLPLGLNSLINDILNLPNVGLAKITVQEVIDQTVVIKLLRLLLILIPLVHLSLVLILGERVDL